MSFLFDMSEVVSTSVTSQCSICPFAKGLKEKLETPQMLRRGTTASKLLIVGNAISKYAKLCDVAVVQSTIAPLVALIPSEFTVYYTPSALCYSEHTEKASVAVQCCSYNLLQMATGFQYVLLSGSNAIRGFYHHLRHGGYDALWRGNCIPDYRINSWVVPLLGHLNNEGKHKAEWELIKQDIKENVIYDKSFPTFRPNCILNHHILDELQDGDIIAFDYETSGLKPDNAGHFIYSISVCKVGSNDAYSFLLTDQNKAKWIEVLKNPEIKKIAHNIKMEERWSRDILGTPVLGWLWDTCIGAHCINSIQGNSGLKFQAFLNFGVEDYASSLSSYLKASDSNSFNDIMLADPDAVLQYGALDAYYTAMLYPRQLETLSRRTNSLGKSFTYGAQLFTNVQRAFALMESNGIAVDTVKMQEYEQELEDKKRVLLDDFISSDIYTQWENRFREKTNLNSTQQLSELLFTVMGYTPAVFTEKGVPAVDEEALAELGIKELDGFIRVKKYNKIVGTYYSQFKREIDGYGLIHCDMRLNATMTFRTSCTNPNLQNISRQDKEQAYYIRSLFHSQHKDWVLVEADLKGCEVAGSACHTKDANLLAYVSDASLDMHRDIGTQLYKVDKDLISKDLRSITKVYTFGTFYGSYWKHSGPKLWKLIEMLKPTLKDGTLVQDYLKGHGLRDVESFTNHVRGVDDFLWNEQFPGYTKWKRKMVEFYDEHGYVDMFTGFRRYGPMNSRQIVNTPIQGDSGHINLWLCLYVLNRINKSGIPAKLFLQIHDSILGIVHPDYLNEYCRYYKEGIVELRKQWDWMICPFEIEFEVAPVGGSWYDKKEYVLK